MIKLSSTNIMPNNFYLSNIKYVFYSNAWLYPFDTTHVIQNLVSYIYT